MQSKVLAIATVLCFSACTATAEPTSADVHYRSFDATSIVRLTEEIMITSAGSELHISDPSRLARIRKLIDAPCQSSDQPQSEMDLRVLIYFNGESGRSTWKASRLDFYDSSTDRMCRMSESLKDALSQELGNGS